MFTDVYLMKNNLSSVSELWQEMCKEEDLLFFQPKENFPARLCEEALKEALAVVYFQGEEGDSWEKSEEFLWARRYQLPVFFFAYDPTATQNPAENKSENQVSVTQEGRNFHYSYENNQDLRLLLQDLGRRLKDLALLKYTQLLENQPLPFEFAKGESPKNQDQIPQEDGQFAQFCHGNYQGQLFLDKQPMGWGVFSISCENQGQLLCCGIWNCQENGDFFALQGKIFQNILSWEQLLYQGDFFLTQKGTILFMDGNASCYEKGRLIYKGGIYGNTLTDYCLYGKTFSVDETFSGYYSTNGTRIYGSLHKNGEEIYQGTFHNAEKEGYGKEQLGRGKRYTGPFVANDFCGAGAIEYQGKNGTILVWGNLPKDRESFTEITQILAQDGRALLSAPTPLAFPPKGQVKLEYPSRMTYVGRVDGCKKTDGLFRKGNQQWEMSPSTSYDQFEEGFLFHLLQQLDEEESWWALAFGEFPWENLRDYHLDLCQHLQELHRAFAKKSVEFPDLQDYPYENPDPFVHLQAYLQCKPSERIHLCVYALEAISDLLQQISPEKMPFPLVIAWDSGEG